MRLRADVIELLDANKTIVSRESYEGALAMAGAQGTSTVTPTTIHESLTAEVSGSVLNYWSMEDSREYAHTYHGAFLVHWRGGRRRQSS